jgi:hypothetical protein
MISLQVHQCCFVDILPGDILIYASEGTRFPLLFVLSHPTHKSCVPCVIKKNIGWMAFFVE